MNGPCRLKIETDDMSVDLCGDAAFVRAGYAALRGELLSRLQPVTSDLPAVEERVDDTLVGPPRPGDLDPDYVWVYRCNELYSKVYVLQREQLVSTGLGRIVDLERVRRVYLDAEDAPALEDLIPRGKTLWSELTGLGQQRLRTS